MAIPAAAGVEAALQAMQRGHEAVVCCPVSQLRGGELLPDPPGSVAEGGSEATAAPEYAECTLELLDFSQVCNAVGGGWLGQLVQRLCQLGRCLVHGWHGMHSL